MNILKKINWHFKRKFFSTIYFFRFSFYPYIGIEGIKIPVNYKWSYSMLKALINKEYEGGELKIIIQTLQDNDKVLEIGTGLGLLSAFCAKRIGNEKVKTFEANPLLKSQIRKLYALNDVKPDLNIALASVENGSVTFYAEPKNIWASSSLKFSDTSIELRVRSININEVIDSFSPNYLIMDIEGAEYDLLPKINLLTIRKIQIELHKKFIGNERVDFLIDFLMSKGFEEIKEYSSDEQFFFLKK